MGETGRQRSSIAAGLLAAALLLVGASGDRPLEGPVTIEVFVVNAVQETRAGDAELQAEKRLDPGLEPIAKAFEELPFNRFKKVKTGKASVKAGEESSFALTAAYTLRATPTAKDREDRIRLSVRLDEKVKKEDKEVTRCAVETTSALAPGKPLLLRGLKSEEGELIILLLAQETGSDSPR